MDTTLKQDTVKLEEQKKEAEKIRLQKEADDANAEKVTVEEEKKK